MWLAHYYLSYNPCSLWCGEVEHSVFDRVGSSMVAFYIKNAFIHMMSIELYSFGIGITLKVLVLVLVLFIFLNDTQPYTLGQNYATIDKSYLGQCCRMKGLLWCFIQNQISWLEMCIPHPSNYSHFLPRKHSRAVCSDVCPVQRSTVIPELKTM